MHPKVVILTLYNKEAYILRKRQLLKKFLHLIIQMSLLK